MNWRGKAAAGAAAGAVLIAGCTAAAHLSALQRGPVRSSGSVAVPPSVAGEYRTPKIQLGIDVDAYTYPGEDMAKAARAVVKYVRSLHANAISITFPFFMNGPHAATVTTRPSTPTPHMIQAFARIAEAHGLYVAFRPLLDEASIGHGFRGNLHLSHPAEWFASYRRFLLPYASGGAAGEGAGVRGRHRAEHPLQVATLVPARCCCAPGLRRAAGVRLELVRRLQPSGRGRQGPRGGRGRLPGDPHAHRRGLAALRPPAAPGHRGDGGRHSGRARRLRRTVQALVAREADRREGPGRVVLGGLPRGGRGASGRDLLLVDRPRPHVPRADAQPTRSTGVAAARAARRSRPASSR